MPKNEKGFSLVESLAAMLLLLAGLLAVAPLFILGIKVTETSADMGVIGAIAVEQMETLRAENYTDLSPGGSLTSDVTGYALTTTDGYSIRWTVTANTGGEIYKTLRVRVVAPRRVMGQTKELTLQNIRAASR